MLIKTRITPTQLNFLSFFFAISSAIFFLSGVYRDLLIGALLLNISFILDNSDGEVARYKKMTSEFGVWNDTTLDILSSAVVFVGLTIGLYIFLESVNILIVGFIATINVLIMYTFIIRRYQKVKEYREFKFGGGRFFIGSGCAITVLLTVAAIFNKVYYFLLFWATIGTLIWIKQYFSNYKLFKSL